MSYTNPPSPAYLDTTNVLAQTLQSLVLFDGASGGPSSPAGLPRNLVNNAMPRTFHGCGLQLPIPTSMPPIGLNVGEYALWQTSQFTADTTASPMMRWAPNSKCLFYPYGGVSNGTYRASKYDRTYFAFFAVDACDVSANATRAVMLHGQCGSWYGNNGNLGNYFDGMSVVFNGGSAYLAWTLNQSGQGGSFNNSLVCVNSAGSINSSYSCPIVAGDLYFATIAISRGSTPYMRFYLYNLTTSTQISQTGGQYFTFSTGAGNEGTVNQRYSNWNPNNLESTSTAGGLADHVIGGLDGVFRMRMCGIDNQFWDDTSGTTIATPPAAITGGGFANIQAYIQNNPYVILTGTRPSGGSTDTAIVDTTGANVNNGSSKMVGNAYQTRWVASSTLTGIYAGLPLCAKADWCLAFSDNAKLIFDASPPIGQAAMTNYKLYGVLATTVPTGSPPSVSAVGTQLLSQSTLPITYTPPDTGLRYYQLVATDGTNTYTYHVIPAALKSRAPLRIMLAGNSIFSDTGSAHYIMLGMGMEARRKGFDLAITTMAIDGTGSADFLTGAGSKSYYAPNPSISGTVTQLDYLCSRAAAEKAATGANVDWVLLQLAGNTPTTSTANYSTIAGAVLGGNGITNNYTAAVKNVGLCAGPFQLNGHPINTDFQIVTNNSNLQAASNGTTIQFLGQAAQNVTADEAQLYSGGHPTPTQAVMEGVGLMLEILGFTGAIPRSRLQGAA